MLFQILLLILCPHLVYIPLNSPSTVLSLSGASPDSPLSAPAPPPAAAAAYICSPTLSMVACSASFAERMRSMSSVASAARTSAILVSASLFTSEDMDPNGLWGRVNSEALTGSLSVNQIQKLGVAGQLLK